jgi:hypothetical protein
MNYKYININADRQNASHSIVERLHIVRGSCFSGSRSRVSRCCCCQSISGPSPKAPFRLHWFVADLTVSLLACLLTILCHSPKDLIGNVSNAQLKSRFYICATFFCITGIIILSTNDIRSY